MPVKTFSETCLWEETKKQKKMENGKYTKYFIKNGFDDLNFILEQMKNGYGLTDENLQEIGIIHPGVRAKILIKLEEGINSN